MRNWIFDKVPTELELKQICTELTNLSNTERLAKRSEISDAIITDNSNKLVVLSGPGTGKTYLFLNKIKHLLKKDPKSKILITTFVKKLADDLQDKINLEHEIGSKAESKTLHSFACELLGTSKRYSKYRNVFDNALEEEIWLDMRHILGVQDGKYSLIDYKASIHDLKELSNDNQWNSLNELYLELVDFYNAISFDDQIRFAYEELKDGNIKNEVFNSIIVDEYQDFNKLENKFIELLTSNMSYSLFAGDDDQVLYDSLKNSHREYIEKLYADNNFNRSFLPFCSRCSNNITQVAANFIKNYRVGNSNKVDKIFLPISQSDESSKVRVVLCYSGAGSVDYLKKFINENDSEIEASNEKLKKHESVDPFMFVITPSLKKRFLSRFKNLKEIIEEKQHIYPHLTSTTYDFLLNCLVVHDNNEDNLAFRRVMFFKELEKSSEFVKEAYSNKMSLCSLEYDDIKIILKDIKEIVNIIHENKNNIDTLVDRLMDLACLEEIANKENLSKDRLVKEIEDYKFSVDATKIDGLNAVELLSYQKCKGLSTDHVFILGFDDIYMSHVTPDAFFVAMTRAKNTLHLIMTMRMGANSANKYLDALPLSCIDFCKYTKSKGLETLGSRENFDSQIETWSWNG